MEVKRAILKRDKYKCRRCGSRNNLHVHHIIFRSQQGPDEEWNLITVCTDCHSCLHKTGKIRLTVAQGDGAVDANKPVRFEREWL